MRHTEVNLGEHPEYVIVGVGRIEQQFKDSRSSVGFDAIDYLDSISSKGTGCKRQVHIAFCDKCMLDGVIVLLVKPNVFLANCGMTVHDILLYYAIHPSKVIVLYDDHTLDVGRLKIGRGKTEFHHDALSSIAKYLKSNSFFRIGIGISGKEDPEELRIHKLSPFEKEELKLIRSRYKYLAEWIRLIGKYSHVDPVEIFKIFNEDEEKMFGKKQ